MLEARCRLCAEIRDDLVELLNDNELLCKINNLFHIQVTPKDGDNDANNKLPKSVCNLCRDTVNSIWEFNERVQKAQDLLLSNDAQVQKQVVNEEEYDEEEEEEEDEDDVLNGGDVGFDEEFCGGSDGDVKPKVTRRSTRNKDLASKVSSHADVESKPSDSFLYAMKHAKLNEDGSVTMKDIVTNFPLTGWDRYEWKCNECQQHLTKLDDLKSHYSSLHNNRSTSSIKYSCLDCPKTYISHVAFMAHVKRHRPHLKLACDVCFKWFPTEKKQRYHRERDHADRAHDCPKCDKSFRLRSSLRVHMRLHLPADERNCYECDVCSKRFSTKPNLVTHKRIHAGVREYTCDQCGKSFVQKGNLDCHMLTHNVSRPHVCQTCGKTFKTSIRLKKHNLIHSDVKPHRCDVCGREFRERGTLREHNRIHTGAMPYTCEFCDKRFRFKSILINHRRLHTGERPYSCHECQHHFTNWANYNKHMKRRHGINTSVRVRKPQTIPPTGVPPQRNPPGTILAPPQYPTATVVNDTSYVIDEEHQQAVIANAVHAPATAPTTFYPVLSLYSLPEEHCYIK